MGTRPQTVFVRKTRRALIHSRFYNVKGEKWEARFFQKGEPFPETGLAAPRQGVWARPVSSGWESPVFVGGTWRFVTMDPDVLYLPQKKRS